VSVLVEPVYTGTLDGKPLRFFKAPLAGPHLPWHAMDDLHVCLALPRSLRRHFRQQLQSSQWAKDVRTVATSAGIATIAPHWVAQGLIGAVIEIGHTPAATEMAYARQAVGAWNAITGDLKGFANVNLMMAAFRNTNGIA
jgi:hypothetical protein